MTYLPVRLELVVKLQQSPAPGTMRTDFQWLSPTAANVARTRVTVPAGFKRVYSLNPLPAKPAGSR